MILSEPNGHLNEEGIALFAEGLLFPAVYARIPAEVSRHVEECMECKLKIMELADIIREDDETMKQIASGISHKETHGPVKDKKLKTRWMLWIAAAATVIVLAGLYLFLKPIPKSVGEKLFADNFEPYQNLITVKGAGKPLAEAMYYYDLKMWDSAILYFERIQPDEADTAAVMFYQANALLASGKVNEAIVLLQTVEWLKDDRFKPQAAWYLALAYIKSGRQAEAVTMLNQLTVNDSFYGQKAGALLNELHR